MSPSSESQTSKNKLSFRMATALSLDHWVAPEESLCEYKEREDLAVNFLCMDPAVANRNSQEKNRTSSSSSSSWRKISLRRSRRSNDTSVESKKKDSIISLRSVNGDGKEDESDNDPPDGDDDADPEAVDSGNKTETQKDIGKSRENRGEEEEEEEDDDDDDDEPPPKLSRAARYQEIFIDLVGLEASSKEASTRYLFDERFDSFLTDDNAKFKRAVLDMMQGSATMDDPAIQQTEGYQRLERFLRHNFSYGAYADLATTTTTTSASRSNKNNKSKKQQQQQRLANNNNNNSKQDTALSENSDQSATEGLKTTTRRRRPIADAITNSLLKNRIKNKAASKDDTKGEEEETSTFPFPHIQRLTDLIQSDSELARSVAFSDVDTTNREEMRQFLYVTLPSNHTKHMEDIMEEFETLWEHQGITDSKTKKSDDDDNDDGDEKDNNNNEETQNEDNDEEDATKKDDAEDDDATTTITKEQVTRAKQIHKAFVSLFRVRGHVYVCNGSVCQLSCDAFLCPVAISTKNHQHVTGFIYNQWKSWYSEEIKGGSGLERFTSSTPNAGHTIEAIPEKERIFALSDFPMDQLPLILLGQVNSKETDMNKYVEELVETVTQFLAAAYHRLQGVPPRNRRNRHLLAVPVLGTGGGGGGEMTGRIVSELLFVLLDFCRDTKMDCVLVCADSATYAHAQSIRRRNVDQFFLAKDASTSLYLPKAFRRAAEEFAEIASRQKLSLFLGAGVSMGSGLPGWFELLETIHGQFVDQGKGSSSLGDDCNWDPLVMADQMEKMAANKPDKEGRMIPLKVRVCTLIEEQKALPSLLLQLLVGLPTQSIVTQNYDQLIEHAHECWNIAERSSSHRLFSKGSLSVLPHRPVKNASRWLLHMHGCVSHPEFIVLTKRDYEDQQDVLSGLVQANLMTSHFLFCGFSLTDPNYLRIVKEVREALHPFGSAKDTITKETAFRWFGLG